MKTPSQHPDLTDKEWWDLEAIRDERYATRTWGGDGTPESVAPTMSAIFDQISPFLGKYGNALDLGCGPGRILLPLAEAYPDTFLWGADISDAMLDMVAGALLPDVDLGLVLLPGDGSLNLDNDSFDFVYSVEVFQHCEHEVVARYLREIHRVLAPRGIAKLQFVVGEDVGPMNHPARFEDVLKWASLAGFTECTGHFNIHPEWLWLTLKKTL